MSEQSRPAPAERDGDSGTKYSERLWVPLWWWPIGLAITGLLAAEIHMGAPGLRAWLPYVILFPLPVWVLLFFSRLTVEVVPAAGASAGELRVGRAHLPLNVVARAGSIPASAKSAALGRQLDPAAYVQHRPWVPSMVLVVLDDPDDPTPYWLLSTRRPAALLAAMGVSDAGASSSAPETR
ncbi:DUF3093 domain-containing protein [Antrihabitans cavernicola]|uniref:DUF3093 domain-containing protein n=1 Tax=Antrihabitans cavernicola TaxID=2495913 RepID=A0A5A7SGR2_9NOCA|nr:DUF3093 domain-containing protein [Spelaeibacter cavernicola]KAA0023401.1 DUF3093 domain-containing protein [Spelaeibacter cavernicola]